MLIGVLRDQDNLPGHSLVEPQKFVAHCEHRKWKQQQNFKVVPLPEITINFMFCVLNKNLISITRKKIKIKSLSNKLFSMIWCIRENEFSE